MKWIKKNIKWNHIIGILIVIMLLVCGFALYSFTHAVSAVNLGKVKGEKKFDYHFAMIHSGSNDDFWTSLYDGAKKAGEEVGAYVEDFGESVPGNYSEEDLVNMAIAAKVDGIIVEGSQSDQMEELINQAEDNDITVVTVLQDVAGSTRRSYVGVNNYAMGEIYGNQIVEALQKKQELDNDSSATYQVSVLIDASKDTSSSSLVFSGIQECVQDSGINIQLNSVNIEKNENFESEEVIRNILLSQEKRPDAIVNLSSVDTINCYHTIIEYNLVGKVAVIGYYSDDEVLNGIKKGVIQSSVDINANKIGESCVNCLYKFLLKGYVNEYINADINLITQDNVDQYLKERKSEEGE